MARCESAATLSGETMAGVRRSDALALSKHMIKDRGGLSPGATQGANKSATCVNMIGL